MRILYVTMDWPGFEDCLYSGQEFASGLPSFNKPLKYLIDNGNDVNFIILTTKKDVKLNIKSSWLKESMIKKIVVHNETPSLITKLKNIKNMINAVDEVLSAEKYDFVYAHGTSTGVARIAAKKHGVAYGQRLYGTFLWERIGEMGKIKACIRHIVEYRAFTAPKDFLIVTNDGSKGDKCYNLLNKKKNNFEFRYWINGVDKRPEPSQEVVEKMKSITGDEPFIFYPARVDGWKRQDRAVRIIAELKKRGRKVNLFYSGLSDNRGLDYFNEVQALIKELDVEDRVTYMGNLDMPSMDAMNKASLCSMSLYDVCNLTNVFHEMLSVGAVILVRNDGTINDFIEDKSNGFLINSDEEAVAIIENLLDGKYDTESIREKAISTSRAKMKTWDERCLDEVKLIKQAVEKNNR